jgi:hypothetical protein
MRQGELRAEERSPCVHRHDAIPFLRARMLDRRLELDARIAHEDVELADPFGGFVDQAPCSVGIAHVGDDRDDTWVLVDRFDEACVQHVGALCGEASRDRRADAAAGAGDRRGLTGEPPGADGACRSPRSWGRCTCSEPPRVRGRSRSLYQLFNSCSTMLVARTAVHLADLSSDPKSPTGPRWASLSGFTIELMLVI